jgi:4-amino-4-deoxy-L-arabinose transferase-like glycosyltransferase
MSPRPRAAVLAIALAALALWIGLSPPHRNDVVGGDEGYYGVMARNALAAPRFLVSPALTPLGPPGDKPPLYPALLALFVRGLGPTEAALRLPSLLCAALIVVCLASLVARAAGAWGAIATAGFLVSLPWFAGSSHVATAEIPLTAFGALALVVLAGGPPTPRRALGAGALLGLGFLCKLWLVALIAIPAIAMVLPSRRALLALGAGALIVGAAQIAAVAAFAPHDLAHWWSVYAGFSLASRVGGAGYAPDWIHPPTYYLAALAHAFVLLVPLVLVGAWEAARRRREPVVRALLLWGLGFVPLSAFRVKSVVYLYPIVPALAALAALGIAALARRWPRAAAALGIAIAVASLAHGGRKLTLRYHDPGYRVVAAKLAPLLRDAAPDRPSYVAPEAPAFGYYLFRTGRYWGTPLAPWSGAQLEALAADTTLRAFVVDPTDRFYGGWPDSTALRWLERSAREITGEIEREAGRKLEVRVFVQSPSR